MVVTMANGIVHVPSEGDGCSPAPIYQNVSPILPDIQPLRISSKPKILTWNLIFLKNYGSVKKKHTPIQHVWAKWNMSLGQLQPYGSSALWPWVEIISWISFGLQHLWVNRTNCFLRQNSAPVLCVPGAPMFCILLSTLSEVVKSTGPKVILPGSNLGSSNC